jgi:hypothetical protein
MATLQRRVQILFDPAQYAALEAEAAAQRQSVAALIREAVDERLRRTRQSKQAAWAALLARAEADPVPAPENWDEFKDELERDAVREL